MEDANILNSPNCKDHSYNSLNYPTLPSKLDGDDDDLFNGCIPDFTTSFKESINPLASETDIKKYQTKPLGIYEE